MATEINFDEDSCSGMSDVVSSLNITEPRASQERQNKIQTLREACDSTAYLDGRFFIPDLENISNDSVAAKCQLCSNPKIIKGPLKSASNFISHLKRAHSEEYENQYKPYSQAKRQKMTNSCVAVQGVSRVTRQRRFEENVISFVLESMCPFSTVEMPSFRKIIDDLGPRADGFNLQHMSRRTLGRCIKATHLQNMDRLRTIMKDGTNYICTTADIWSSSTRRFLGVTAHWIDPSTFKINSAAIACRRFPGGHSYDRIAELLNEIYISFGFDSNKLVATVTDNATNFVKAFQEFGIKMTVATFDGKYINKKYILRNWIPNGQKYSPPMILPNSCTYICNTFVS